MGINNGKDYLKIDRNARTNSIKELSGKKMGIDLLLSNCHLYPFFLPDNSLILFVRALRSIFR